MRLATTMWGGRMCPMIPVPRRLPAHWNDGLLKPKPVELALGYLRFFEPDVLVETEASQISRLGLAEEKSFRTRRYYTLDDLVGCEVGMQPDLNIGLNMCDRYAHLYRTEFQFQKRFQPRVFSFLEGKKADVTFFEAAFGYFPNDDSLPYVADIYEDTLGAEQVTPSVETWLEIVEGRTGHPLYFTCRDLKLETGYRSDPSIFIFDPTKPTDIIDFWNFRIFTRNVLPVNSRWIANSRKPIADFIRQNYRPLPRNPNGVMIRPTVQIARSLNLQSVIDELSLEQFKLPKGGCSFQDWYHDIWRTRGDEERIERPVASILSASEKDIQITPSDKNRGMIRFPTLSPEFSGGAFGLGPRWINTVEATQYTAKADIAAVLPSTGFKTKPGYPTKTPHDQFVSREGFVTFHQFPHDESYLELPSPTQAIKSWLASEEIEAIQSDAGRVADQVIDSVGGLFGTHAFRDISIVKFLNNMARSHKEFDDGSGEEFSDRTASVDKWLQVLNPLQKKDLGNWRTLEKLVECGILKAGISLACTHCTYKNWYSLDGIKSTVQCSRCLKEFPFPQGDTRKARWAYRIVGPFATPKFAQGGYTVALALKFLNDEIGSLGDMTFTTGIEMKKNGVTKEADFFAWLSKGGPRRTTRNPITLVGECKSLGSDSFNSDDISGLKEIVNWIPGAYLVAASMKDVLSTYEVQRLQELAAWGWTRPEPSPVIVLTALELFGDYPFTHGWQEAGGRAKAALQRFQNIFDLATLAAATQEVHLKMKAEEIAGLRYGKSMS